MIRKLFKKVFQLTKDQKLVWCQSGPRSYRASHNQVWVEIELLGPVANPGGTGSVDVARIHMENMELTFFEGTEGMNMIRKILRIAFPQWKERINHSKDQLRQNLEALARIG